MPGKVTRAHVKQEETCSNCHDRSNASHARRRCASTATRTSPPTCASTTAITAAWPTPAPANAAPAIPNTRAATPTSCSSAAAQFDHHLTDFALEGAHADARLRQLPQGARGVAQGAGDLRRLPQGRRRASRPVHPVLRRVPQLHELERRQVRPRQDGVQADRRARDAWPATPATSAAATSRRRRPATAATRPTTSTAARAATTAASATSPRNGRRAKFDHLKETGYELLGVHAQGRLPRLPPQRQLQGQDPEGLQRLPPRRRCARGALRREVRRLPRQRCSGAWPTYDHAARHKFALRRRARQDRLPRLPHRRRRRRRSSPRTAPAAIAARIRTAASSRAAAKPATARSPGAAASRSITT